MKFLMVSHYFDSHRGGIELVADALSCGLVQRQCHVGWAAADVSSAPCELVNRTALPLKTWNGVEKISGLPFPVPRISALIKLFRAVSGFDIVLLHDCLYLANIAAFFRARMLGIPIMVIQHIGAIPYRNPLLATIFKLSNAFITRPMLASADQVVFISCNTVGHFASVRFRNPPALVFNGVNTDIFRPAAGNDEKDKIRDSFNLPRMQPIALFVGRFVEKKGLPIIKRIAESRPDWFWVFAGWGPLDPNSWNVNNVRVFSELSGASLAALYRACDIFVLPSTGEGFPLVIQEALASGLPVVCSAETAEADDSLQGAVRGIPVALGKDDHVAREFVSAIDDLLNSDATSIKKSSERRAFAVSSYSWDRATERYIEIASRLIQGRGTGKAQRKTASTQPEEN